MFDPLRPQIESVNKIMEQIYKGKCIIGNKRFWRKRPKEMSLLQSTSRYILKSHDMIPKYQMSMLFVF